MAEGAKGPNDAKVAWLPVYLARSGLPMGDQQWLFLRKNTDGKLNYTICNAPKEIALAELAKASIPCAGP